METVHPTPYPALNALLHELASGAKTVLGDNFTGAYLQGSLAIGDFDEHSDIDFLIVTENEISETELPDLQALHSQIHRLGGRFPPDCPTTTRGLRPDHWETSLEGSYFPRKSLRHQGPLAEQLWYLDNGSSILERSDHDNTLVVRWALRERGITILGPPPVSLVDPVGRDALRREVQTKIRVIQGEIFDSFWNSRFGQPYAVMTCCRMLMTLETRMIHSKREGVVWGRKALDPCWQDLIQRAWNARGHGHVSEPADPEDFRLTREFVDYAVVKSAL